MRAWLLALAGLACALGGCRTPTSKTGPGETTSVTAPGVGMTVHIFATPSAAVEALGPAGLAEIDHRVYAPPGDAGVITLSATDFAISDPESLLITTVARDGRERPVASATLRSAHAPRIGDHVAVATGTRAEIVHVGYLIDIDPDYIVLESRSASLELDTEAVRAQLVPSAERRRLDRAEVRGIRVLDVEPDVRFSLGPDAGERPLLRLVYRTRALSWRPTYELDIRDLSAVRVHVRSLLENRDARDLPEARVHLYGVSGRAPVHTGRHALPGKRAVVVDLYEWTVSARRGYAIELSGSALDDKRSAELDVQVRSELVVHVPADHPVHALGPGDVVALAPRAISENPEPTSIRVAPPSPERAARPDALSGTWRVPLPEPSPVHARARVTWYRQPEGRYARYRVDIGNPTRELARVALWLPIPEAGRAELVDVMPSPSARAPEQLFFDLVLDPDTESFVTCLVYLPE